MCVVVSGRRYLVGVEAIHNAGCSWSQAVYSPRVSPGCGPELGIRALFFPGVLSTLPLLSWEIIYSVRGWQGCWWAKWWNEPSVADTLGVFVAWASSGASECFFSLMLDSQAAIAAILLL